MTEPTSDRWSDDELERRVRGALERRSRMAAIDVPVVERARAAARRRRAGRVSAGLAAAAVVAVAGVAVAVDGDRGRDAPRDPAGPSTTAVDPADTSVPAGWRVESWRGLEVSVPPDWGWGAAPIRPVAGDDLALCGGPGAMVTAAGQKLVNADASLPYVGRPVLQSDMCVGAPYPQPEAPYVWLGAALEPGTVELGDGYVQETVVVGGASVTVATADAELRARILASATETGPGACRAVRDQPPPPVRETTVEGRGDLHVARICAYRRLDGDGPLDLVYSADVAAGDVEGTLAAVDAAPPSDVLCKDTSEVVVLEATYLDPYSPDPDLRLRERTVFDLTCGHVTTGDWFTPAPVQRRLTEATVRPWASGGVGSVLVGPSAPWVYDYFIGMQG
ncbi:hypothetical protein [Nocardioides ferulae]|uniref:hypothetical protein n=1 Tax=Nocardioides ferulae TaxID=2340821 RepID=UPI0013DDFCC5|nr:hypothetical protein [Nocardioides ferulae]